jgi:hydroxyacylglutathione hydrolase
LFRYFCTLIDTLKPEATKKMIQIETLTFNAFQENTYILYDETLEAVIIDPGCLSQAEKETLAQVIINKNLTIKYLLQTHAHLDHVFGSAFVKRKYGVSMLMHKNEVPILKAVETRAPAWGIKGYEPVEADGFLEEGDVVKFGNSILQVIFVPGHAPGHLAFINNDQKIIIGGDVLFKGSIGRYDFDGCSKDDLFISLKNKFMALPDDFTVYSGHGPTTTIGQERRSNPFLVGGH